MINTTEDKIAAIVIFLLAPLTGVGLGSWVAALVVVAFGLLLAMLAAARQVAEQHYGRRPVQEGETRAQMYGTPRHGRSHVCAPGSCYAGEWPHELDLPGDIPSSW